ncbi:MAG: HU family DNA-binding protein [Candidatus Sungbacteria bacterium]|uniref:HU family DNA-binding protein n=1 Tax=Candidatus Sungiibacteriota bacterium TaxID=2750080 RepID=A0A9D6LTW1_9BACT|nr:HU family DNA-binding protein [Candidatus Sungbacteria bacterium]
MNKADIIEAVHGKLQGTKKSAEEAVEVVFGSITNGLSKGQEVSISGFGTFIVRKRAARQGVNPRTGEKIQIKATTTPKFRAGKVLKEAVR